MIYTLVESAKRCGANPFEYVRDVLARLPETRHSEVPRLLPNAWLKAHANESAPSRPTSPTPTRTADPSHPYRTQHRRASSDQSALNSSTRARLDGNANGATTGSMTHTRKAGVFGKDNSMLAIFQRNTPQ